MILVIKLKLITTHINIKPIPNLIPICNRNTLSAIINEHKGTFSAYVNKLRIDQLLKDLVNQPHLRQLSLEQLADIYGFANTKTLTIQFKDETQLAPNYFIKQLELRDLELKKKAS